MYAGPPKIAQELFFWSYHLRVSSSNWRKYFVVEAHYYIYNHTPVNRVLLILKILKIAFFLQNKFQMFLFCFEKKWLFEFYSNFSRFSYFFLWHLIFFLFFYFFYLFFLEFFLYFFLGGGIPFKVTKVTTGHQKLPKIGQNSIIRSFFCPAEGRRPKPSAGATSRLAGRFF